VYVINTNPIPKAGGLLTFLVSFKEALGLGFCIQFYHSGWQPACGKLFEGAFLPKCPKESMFWLLPLYKFFIFYFVLNAFVLKY
jgi:hypothetical protein